MSVLPSVFYSPLCYKLRKLPGLSTVTHFLAVINRAGQIAATLSVISYALFWLIMQCPTEPSPHKQLSCPALSDYVTNFIKKMGENKTVPGVPALAL